MKTILVLLTLFLSTSAMAKSRCNPMAQPKEGWAVTCHPYLGQLPVLNIPQVKNGMHVEGYELCFGGPYTGQANILWAAAYQPQKYGDNAVGMLTCYRN